MINNEIENFINEHNYDVRISGNGRWMDQKCALDEVCFVADCIVEYLRNGGKQPFQSPDIWRNEYSIKNVQDVFNKPDPTNYATHDEYNKFFRQPMKMLSAAGVLKENGKVKNTIQFSVERQDILEFIALRERNAFQFLRLYIEKTLKDSELWDAFSKFFSNETKDELNSLKKTFSDFSIKYTKINTNVEANRIFIKVLNPLSCKYHKKGTIKGLLSADIITLDQLMYNHKNWRDEYSGKNKSIARSDYMPTPSNEALYRYRVQKSINNIRRFNNLYNKSETELFNKRYIGIKAVHMHHIFPRYGYPQIADYLENIIALTVEQHLAYAHPDGNTHAIDKGYQYSCLIAKTDSIKKNLTNNQGEPTIYSFECLAHVLDVGFNTDEFKEIVTYDFNAVLNKIEEHCA